MKRLGLVAIAAIALIAIAGTSSAFAAKTTLCKSNAYRPFCLGTDAYPSGTSVEASSSNAKIEIPSLAAVVNCSTSGLSGTTSAESGEPLPASLHWALGGCEAHGEHASSSCTVENVFEAKTGIQ
jgi:hypothetical protein